MSSNLMMKAMEAKYETVKQVFFGDMEWEMRAVKFVNQDGGFKLIDADEGDVDADVEIKMTVFPLRGGFEVVRTMLANSRKTPDWTKHVKPSLDRLGITDLDQIYRKFVQVEMVKAGSYVKDGERKDRTTFKFLRVFNSREECEAAAEEHFKNSGGGNNHPATAATAPPTTDDPTAATAPPTTDDPIPTATATATTDNPLLAFAVQSLPALWEAVGHDYKAFGIAFHNNPTYAQVGLTMASPEVVSITGEIPF